METTTVELKSNLANIAKIETESGMFSVTVYLSPNDAAPVIEIDTIEGLGEIRVYVNDGQVFAGDPEGEPDPRFTLKRDAVHRNWLGIWDNFEGTWYIAEGDDLGDATAAGVPMWRHEKDAQITLDRLNGGKQ